MKTTFVVEIPVDFDGELAEEHQDHYREAIKNFLNKQLEVCEPRMDNLYRFAFLEVEKVWIRK